MDQDRNAGGGRTRSAIGPPEDREAGAACGTGGGAPAAALPRLPCRVGLQNMGNTTDRLALVAGVSLLSSLATLLAVGEIQVLSHCCERNWCLLVLVQFRVRGRGAETERLSEAPQSMHRDDARALGRCPKCVGGATFSAVSAQRPRDLGEASAARSLFMGYFMHGPPCRGA